MRVVLRIESGQQQGRSVVLRPGQEVTIGRTNRSDITCETDDWMSGLHFSLCVTRDACFLRDCNSTNGTKLNGTFVKESVLAHGDRILAGQTEFVLEIEPFEGPGVERPVASEPRSAAQRNVMLDHVRTAVLSDAPYQESWHAAGFISCQGCPVGKGKSPPAPSQIVVALTRHAPLTIIIDPNRAGLTIPPGLPTEALYSWLPEGPARQHSPQILALEPSPALDELIDSAWGNDALICLYSKSDAAQLVDHFRGVALQGTGGKMRSGAGVFGFFYPSVLEHLLRSQPESELDRLLKGIDGVLLETRGENGNWQLFARPEMIDHLELLGFRKVG